MNKFKLSGIAVMLVTAVITNAYASIGMSDLFASVSSSRPAVTQTSGGATVLTGGSLRVRTERASFDILTVNSPSISSGCGGIDFFSGGFGLISKDQLVQTGRALIQGASAYYFGLALGAICPICNNEMKPLMDKIAALNEFSRMSCEGAVAELDKLMADDEGKTPFSKVGAITSSWGSEQMARFGDIDDQTSSNDLNRHKEGTIAGISEEVAAAMMLGNNVYQFVLGGVNQEDSGASFSPLISNMTGGVFGDDAVSVAEFIMSLSGAAISVKDTSQDENYREFSIGQAFTVSDFINNTSEGGEDKRWHKCNNRNPVGNDYSAVCTNVSAKGGPILIPLREQVRKMLISEDPSNLGILHRINAYPSPIPFSSQQRDFLALTKINLQGNLIMQEALKLKTEEVSEYLEAIVTFALTQAIRNEFSFMRSELKSFNADSLKGREALSSMGDKSLLRVIEELDDAASGIRAEIEGSYSFMSSISAIEAYITQKEGG